MGDEEIVHCPPVLPRNDQHEIALDRYRGLVLRETEATAQSANMGIDRDAFVLPERVRQDDVRGFPRHSRKEKKLFHRIGYFTSETIADHSGR